MEQDTNTTAAPERLTPANFPENAEIRMNVEDGVFVASFFPDRWMNAYSGTGQGEDVESAVRDALDDAGIESPEPAEER